MMIDSEISVRLLLREGVARLQRAGIGSARQEAEWLLGRLLNAKPLELYLREQPIPSEILERFFMQIEARASGIPVQYLLGEAEFFGRRFAVVPEVFIPRPETEIVVEAALGALRVQAEHLARPLRILDLGTGSGCIAVTLTRALPACVVVGVEVSWTALSIAKQNVHRHGVEERVHLVHGWWLDPIRGLFDGILSNPPYIPSAQVDRLPLEVRQEPRISLDGGEDGMRVLFQLITDAPRLLMPGGILTLECGEEQVDDLVRAASASRWVQTVRSLRDLTGRPRGVLITRASTHG